jgi:hypothetical protein
VAHGTPKALKELNRAREEKAQKRLAAHRLEKDAGDN